MSYPVYMFGERRGRRRERRRGEGAECYTLQNAEASEIEWGEQISRTKEISK